MSERKSRWSICLAANCIAVTAGECSQSSVPSCVCCKESFFAGTMDPSVNDQSFVHRNAPLSEAQKLVESFWRKEAQGIQNMNFNDFRNPELPLARIKKIMKLDEDVKMISGEAPVLFAKAVEIFIAELSLRAWVNTEENKRRTLQRNDIATGISKYDQFDFLIDIVPREEAKPVTGQVKRSEVASNTGVVSQDPLNYFFQVAQGPTGQSIQVIQAGAANQSQQQFAIAPQVFQLPVQNTATNQSQDSSSVLSTSQMVQLGNQVADGSQATNGEKAGGLAAATTASAPIILSNVYGNNGEVVQQMPITLTQQQYQALLQNQGTNQSGQPIIIQSNQQSLSMPTQYITNAGQVMQAIIPNAAGSIEQQGTSADKVQSQANES